MNILSIETSCDETAISVVTATGDFPHAHYEVAGNAIFSQIDIHQEYGGVFPNVAKREHIVTVVPMLEKALRAARLETNETTPRSPSQKEKLYEMLYREEGLADKLISFHEQHGVPSIGLIAVTSGPGLEPALWVGVNFAKALSYLWNIPIVAVNHMEGHVLASVFDGEKLPEMRFPALALLISGGHTELDAMEDWQSYSLIGQTRDDAVGEAFDKAARMMGLPYPGGPEISRRAGEARASGVTPSIKLPRPMLDSGDLDFSFSGLKTAVRYAVEKIPELTPEIIQELSLEFENAVTEVLIKKTEMALEQTGAHSLILGGGVSANRHIRETFASHFKKEYPEVALHLPDPTLSTDNSIMIALAGHARIHDALQSTAHDSIKADGNRSLSQE